MSHAEDAEKEAETERQRESANRAAGESEWAFRVIMDEGRTASRTHRGRLEAEKHDRRKEIKAEHLN